MGNEIPRTETIEEDDDNGTKGGVKDTANDRGDDRDRYDANKYMQAILHPQSAKSCRGWWNPGVTIMRCFIHQHLPLCVNIENITNYPPQSMAVASVLLRPSLATTPSLPWPSQMEGLAEVSHYTNGVKGKRIIGNTLSHVLLTSRDLLYVILVPIRLYNFLDMSTCHEVGPNCPREITPKLGTKPRQLSE